MTIAARPPVPPFAAGSHIGQMFGYSVNPCITDDDHNDALDSLRRSLDRKKRQRDLFGPLIDKRLWPNPH